jgi:trimeric autotransporter adhesin
MKIHTACISALLLMLFSSTSFSQGQPGDENWDNRFGTSMDGEVYAVAVRGNDIYIGGSFTMVGGIQVKNIAHWNGSQWSSMGGGVDGFVAALAVDSNGTVYAGGSFTSAGEAIANNIARWDGNQWQPLEAGIDGVVIAMAAGTSGVDVAGRFTMISGSDTAWNVARWNGTGWSLPGNGLRRSASPQGQVNALLRVGVDLIAAGEFRIAETDSIHNVARWDGTQWSRIGNGFNKPVTSVAVVQGKLYAGGEFTASAHAALRYVAMLDGTGAWGALGNDFCCRVIALAESGGRLIVGGRFFDTLNPALDNIAAYDPQSATWSSLEQGIDGTVLAIAPSRDGFIAGGTFLSEGGRNVARWNKGTWKTADDNEYQGIYGDLRTIVVSDGAVYVGGVFGWAGTTRARGVARWDGSRWNGIGGGVDGQVEVIAIDGTDIYVGGRFGMASDVAAVDIVKWNGTQWIPLATNTTGRILSIIPMQNIVYVGGAFTSLNDTAINGIAFWNKGTGAWSQMGRGIYGGLFPTVFAMTLTGIELVVGGKFDSAGTSSASNIALWNGTDWNQLGDGLNGTVKALVTTDDGIIYAGGEFTASGDRSMPYLAKWDGSDWEAVPGAPNGRVEALALADGMLYVGGRFSQTGDVTSPNSMNIARYNPATGAWTSFGSGVGGELIEGVEAIAVAGKNVYAGGDFTIAGEQSSLAFAHWTTPTLSVDLHTTPGTSASLADVVPNPVHNTATIRFTLPHSGDAVLTIHSAIGEQVAVAAWGRFPAGEHVVQWHPDRLPSGIYFCQLQFEGRVTTEQIILLR